MKDRPDSITENQLLESLRSWGIDASSLTYTPVGFGDYHWIAEGDRWFLTVSDLENKIHCGHGAEAAFQGLRMAMDTAAALRELVFVVPPLRTLDGETTIRLGQRQALNVFPFTPYSSSEFDQTLTAEERGRVIDLLGTLHQQRPPTSTPALRIELSGRAQLEKSLAALGEPWDGGLFSEPARALLSDRARVIRRRLDQFDQQSRDLRGDLVVTHGEPHPGNLLRDADRIFLVDWDTVGMAVPERDLWMVVKDADDLARYADATGRAPDPSALALYRLRWDLEDIAVFLGWFQSPHIRSPDTEQGWNELVKLADRVTQIGENIPLDGEDA